MGLIVPGVVDVVFVIVLVVIASLFEYYFFWPRFRAETAAGVEGARARAYRRGIIGQWTFAAVALAVWSWYHRSAAQWRLTLPGGWRLTLGILFVALAIGLVAVQLRSVIRLSPDKRVAVRPKLANVEFLLPHTGDEYRWFLFLSVTAGICEELLYRGYLAWFFATWVGDVWAMALVVAIFGIGHAYQGRKGATRATLAGAVMAAIVLATGSLIPAMIIHAMIDASGGTVGYWLFRSTPQTTRELIPT